MTNLFLASAEPVGSGMIGVIILAIIVYSGLISNQSNRLAQIERQLGSLHKKLDTLTAHMGIEQPPVSPSGLSPEVQALAVNPAQKIAAIKLYRDQNPGVGLAEAKQKIEEFYNSRL